MFKTSKHLVLIVDDEPEVREVLADSLQQAGYQTTAVATGEEMFKALSEQDYSLLITDLRLQGEDGLTLAREVRENSAIPIMMLTGKGDETDRILGLEMAADDYLMKPFNLRELVARVNALIRRSTRLSGVTATEATPVEEPHYCLLFGDWRLDMTARELRHASGAPVDLTYGEFSLLEVLASAPRRVFSREELLERTRGDQSEVFDRTIDVQILRIRRKIEPNPKNPRYIRTERGIGYIFTSPVQKSQC